MPTSLPDSAGFLERAHTRTEDAFEAWGYWVCRRRRAIAATALLATAALATGIPNIRADNSAESFLLPDDPARVDYDAFREQFGQDDLIIVLVEPQSLFELPTLERLRALHRAIEREVPHVIDVTSLLTVRNTRGEGDTLVVEDLLEDWPQDASELATLRERVLDTPLYLNNLVDGRAEITTLLVKPALYSSQGPAFDVLEGFDDDGAPALFLTDAEAAAMVSRLFELLAEHQRDDFRLYMTGGYVGNYHSTQMMMRDVRVFMSLAVLTMGAVLLVLFRRVSGVVLPLVVVLLSLLSTLGIQALLDVPTSVTSQVIPPLLLAVGVCGAVHLLAAVYRALRDDVAPVPAIAGALRHSGLAIAMASLTTAAGLASFAFAPLGQTRNMGMIAPIGVLVALVYVLALLPALLALVPLRTGPSRADRLPTALSAGLARFGDVAVRRPFAVLAITAGILVIGAVGVSRVHFSQYPLAWFPEHDPTRVAAEFTDAKLGGANTLEIVVDTKRENGLHDPKLLARLADAIAFAEEYDDGVLHTAKAISVLDVVRETHRALNRNERAFYAIPNDRRLLAQELLLFENSGVDDLEELVDPQFSTARISLRTPLVDDMYYPRFTESIVAGFRERLGDEIDVQATGMGMLFARTFSVINVGMARSYAIAFGVITPMMILLIGNLRQGLVAMVPNLLPVFLTLALMGFLDIPIDNSTLLVGAIIVGLAVDDTIHFMHKFQRYFHETDDVRTAVRKTLETTGSALLFTSIVLGCGFGVMLFAYMENVADFARLTGFAIVVAFLADVVIAPALLAVVTRPRSARAA